MTSPASSPSASNQSREAFVNWFRDSSPYIHSHRDSTFVISFGGEAVLDENFENHVHDFALLSSLGIRLILVHGIRPQIDSRLQSKGCSSRFQQHLRITDDIALQCVKESAGMVRVELETLLSMGLSNSPMSGAKIRVVSGNFVTAKPLGVIDGVDFLHTGEVRRLDVDAIKLQLQYNHVVLISPVGYSPSGEMFNLCAEQVATEIAIALKAEKLILMTEQECINPENKQLIAQITTEQATKLITQHPELPAAMTLPLIAAIKGCEAGVDRIHILKRTYDGGLLLELFSRNGIGTLVSLTPYEELRTATLNDIAGILDLIKPLEQQEILIKRSRERLEIEIEDYIIIERDGLIIGCTALHAQESFGEIACLVVHPDYQNAARGNRLLKHIQQRAKQSGLEKLYVLSTQTMAWFLEHGFSVTTVDALGFILTVEAAPAMGLLDALEIIQPRIDSIKTALKNTGIDPVNGVAVSESGACDVSGTFSFTGDEGGTSPSFTDSGTVTVANCDDGVGFVMNGTFSWVQSWNIDTGVFSNTLTGGFSITGTDSNNAFSFSFTGVDFAENGNEINGTYTITKATYAVSLVASGVGDFGFLAELTAPIIESNGDFCPESGTILITGANGTTAEGIYNGDGTMTINVNGALVDAAAQCYY